MHSRKTAVLEERFVELLVPVDCVQVSQNLVHPHRFPVGNFFDHSEHFVGRVPADLVREYFEGVELVDVDPGEGVQFADTLGKHGLFFEHVADDDDEFVGTEQELSHGVAGRVVEGDLGVGVKVEAGRVFEGREVCESQFVLAGGIGHDKHDGKHW